MKSLLSASLVLASFASSVLISTPALAVDTSGCSPMPSTTQTITTVQGARLQVTAFKATRPECWNAGQGALVLNYAFMIPGYDVPTVSFWYRVNGREAQQNAQVSCHDASFGGSQASQCIGTLQVNMPSSDGSWSLEVAPIRGGQWDTRGYQGNYQFQF